MDIIEEMDQIMSKKDPAPKLAEFTSRDARGEGDSNTARFLTVAEVAELMRVSKMTVYRLVHSGELPAVRFGRSFRVHSDQVNEYLEKSYYSAG